MPVIRETEVKSLYKSGCGAHSVCS